MDAITTRQANLLDFAQRFIGGDEAVDDTQLSYRIREAILIKKCFSVEMIDAACLGKSGDAN